MNTQTLSEKYQSNPLVEELRASGAIIKGCSVVCPFHNDHKPSGSIYQKQDGSWYYYCHGCGFKGDVYDVRQARTGKKAFPSPGKPEASQLPKEERRIGLGQLRQMYPEAKWYWYYSESQSPLMVVLRLDEPGGKRFLQLHPAPGGEEYIWGAPSKPWPLYRLPQVKQALNVIVVEGEKCADALNETMPEDWGAAATTAPCGAGKAEYADWTPLTGKKVFIWPDFDEKGLDHGRDVKRRLQAIPGGLRGLYWINPAALDLPPKGDAYDFLQKFKGGIDKREGLKVALSKCEQCDGLEDFDRRLRDIAEGKRAVVPFKWPVLTSLTQALLPGTVTILCGSPGSGKSFFLLQCLQHWKNLGIPACVFELEEEHQWHLQRVLAQMAGNSKLLDDTWMRDNAALVKDAFDRHREGLMRMRGAIHTSSSFTETLADLAKWSEKQAQEGNRVICLDPISVATRSEQPWKDDLEFIRSISRTVTTHGCSIVLVAHPKPGMRKYLLDDMAGGAAYQRLSQTVIWIVKEPKPKLIGVPIADNEYVVQSINRRVKLSKTRNGRGQDMEIGFWFNGGTLQFEERGIIAGDAREQG